MLANSLIPYLGRAHVGNKVKVAAGIDCGATLTAGVAVAAAPGACADEVRGGTDDGEQLCK